SSRVLRSPPTATRFPYTTLFRSVAVPGALDRDVLDFAVQTRVRVVEMAFQLFRAARELVIQGGKPERRDDSRRPEGSQQRRQNAPSLRPLPRRPGFDILGQAVVFHGATSPFFVSGNIVP